MSRILLPLSLSASLMAGTALAEVPRVATDIAPVHSLVARVMDGLGTPDLIIPAGASPHEYNLRPSEAAAMQDADLVFWIGADLTPWLDGAMGTLAEGAHVTTLMEVPGTVELAFREGALFEAHDDHGAEEGEDHADEHADEHVDEHAEEDHADDHGHDHAHGAHDPHAWLSPDNATIWLDAIATALSEADPENADAYRANAVAGQQELSDLKAEIAAQLAPTRGLAFIVFHDAYQYFEQAFDMPATGALSLSDAEDPSPARVAEVKKIVVEKGVTCFLSEPQFNPDMIAVLTEGTQVRTGVLDPLGADLTPGPALYPQLLRNLSAALAGCL